MNNTFVQLLVAAISSFTISLLLIPSIIQYSTKRNLIDKPDERKQHKTPVPRLGGLGLFIGSVIGVLLSSTGSEAISHWPILFSSAFVLFLVGLWDDLKSISAKLRFLIQICCAVALASSGLRLTSLHGIFGIHELTSIWQYLVTVTIVVGTTNSFNLIDGVDGLAGGLAFIGLFLLAVLSWFLGLYPLALVITSILGGVAGFLRFNISPAKIFMGDGGALFLGYTMSAVGILLIEQSNAGSAIIAPGKVAILVTSILVIPVFDTIRLFAHRLRRGKSPFSADRNHIHHLLLVAGFDHRNTAGLLYVFELGYILLALFLADVTNVSIIMLLMLMVFHFTTTILRINQSVERWLALVRKIENNEYL